jgi:hypothetical protein
LTHCLRRLGLVDGLADENVLPVGLGVLSDDGGDNERHVGSVGVNSAVIKSRDVLPDGANDAFSLICRFYVCWWCEIVSLVPGQTGFGLVGGSVHLYSTLHFKNAYLFRGMGAKDHARDGDLLGFLRGLDENGVVNDDVVAAGGSPPPRLRKLERLRRAAAMMLSVLPTKRSPRWTHISGSSRWLSFYEP